MIFFILKLFKLISCLLPENTIEKALDSFLSSILGDLPSVLIPEFLSEMVVLALITSSLFSSQTGLKAFIKLRANKVSAFCFRCNLLLLRCVPGIIFVRSKNHTFLTYTFPWDTCSQACLLRPGQLNERQFQKQ